MAALEKTFYDMYHSQQQQQHQEDLEITFLLLILNCLQTIRLKDKADSRLLLLCGPTSLHV